MVVTAWLEVDFDMLYPSVTGIEVPGNTSVGGEFPAEHGENGSYAKIFWYNSGQLVTLPQAIRT